MAICQVRGTVLGVDGNPMINASVTCDLSVPIGVTATGEVVAGEQTTVTADGMGTLPAGTYAFNVYANADITQPTGTSYVITVHSPVASAAVSLSIVVPSTAYNGSRPTYFDIILDDLITAIPATPGVYVQGQQGIQGIQGIQGVVGPMGGWLSWKGTWLVGTAYILGDGVYDPTAAASFVCILGHTGHEPPNATYWVPAGAQLGLANTWPAVQTMPVWDKGGAAFAFKAYGAKGDGVTSDQTAIVATLAAAVNGHVEASAGVYVLTAALTLATANCGMKISGAGRNASVLVQSTDNVPIITSTTFVWGITLEDLWLTYATPQLTAHTGAIAIYNNGGASQDWFHWSLSRLRITNAQTGIGNVGTATIWACTFDDLQMSGFSHQIFNLAGALGGTVCTFNMICYDNAQVPSGDTIAIMTGQMESVWTGLDIEDWASSISYTPGPTKMTGVHIERWTLSAGGYGMRGDDYPLTIGHLTVTGNIDAVGGIDLFVSGNAGTVLDISHVRNTLTIANVPNYKTLHIYAGTAFLRDINETGSTAHTFATTATLAFVKQWDTTFYQGAGVDYGTTLSLGLVPGSSATRNGILAEGGNVHADFDYTFGSLIFRDSHNFFTTLLTLDATGALSPAGVFFPMPHATAGAPAYVKGGVYFDTTLNKLRIGGATAWETVTSV